MSCAIAQPTRTSLGLLAQRHEQRVASRSPRNVRRTRQVSEPRRGYRRRFNHIGSDAGVSSVMVRAISEYVLLRKSKGRCPVSISYNTRPNDRRLDAVDTMPPRSCSGWRIPA